MKSKCKTCQTSKEIEKMLRVKFSIDGSPGSANYYYFCHNGKCFNQQVNKEAVIVYTPKQEIKRKVKENSSTETFPF